MTPQQIDLVQTSFKKVVPIAGTAADLFYDRLFEIAPEVRSLFPQDLGEQKEEADDDARHRRFGARKLTNTIDSCID